MHGKLELSVVKQNKANKNSKKHNFFIKNWYKHSLSIGLYLFVPLSIIFRFIIFLRKMFLYKKNINKKPKIIIIGNIAIGGTGKTPLIIKIATDSGCKWFIVEQDECGGDPFDSLRISYDNLVKYAVT